MMKKQNCLIWIQTASIVYIKTDDTFKGIPEDIETRFDTSSQILDRSLPKLKYKKEIRLMEDELGGKIMTRFVKIRVKSYSY